jgi:hypothetical protein
MVVIRLPAAADAGSEQDRTASPSICTVQAPHRAMPQPYFVPVIPSTSRSTHNSGISGSTSACCAFPLTVSRIITPPFRPSANADYGRRRGRSRNFWRARRRGDQALRPVHPSADNSRINRMLDLGLKLMRRQDMKASSKIIGVVAGAAAVAGTAGILMGAGDRRSERHRVSDRLRVMAALSNRRPARYQAIPRALYQARGRESRSRR